MDSLKMMMMVMMMAMMMVMMSGCGEPPGEAPTLPDPVVWTGRIALSALIENSDGSTTAPDSVMIVLDGDTLGVFSLPDTLNEIPEGTHYVKADGWLAGLGYKSRIYFTSVSYGAVSSLHIGLTQSGNLQIHAWFEGNLLDTVDICLDGDTIFFQNPVPWPPDDYLIFGNIPMGTHNLTVFRQTETLDIEGWSQGIRVEAAEFTKVEVIMTTVAPDSGSHAPGLEALDLDGKTWSLADHWGKVVMLYLFEGT